MLQFALRRGLLHTVPLRRHWKTRPVYLRRRREGIGALAAPDFEAALMSCQPPQREYQLLQLVLVRWREGPAGPDSLVRGRRA